jgi:glycosyltransferase involved in cell wall biosynthesis
MTAPDRTPEVSIIMPVRNEARAIDAALDAVLGQSIDEPFEVVVAEGGSTDGTRRLLERRADADARVRIVDNPTGATPTALNHALREARGKFLVRIDGHSHAPPDYVRRLVAHLRSGECEGVGGLKRAVGRGRFGRAVAAAHGSRFGIGDSKYHYATERGLVDHIPFGAYLTSLTRRIGGWDEELTRSQDVEFDHRYRSAGGRLLLDPSIVIDWYVRETPAGVMRQYYGYGYWKVPILQRDRSALKLRWLVPPTLVASLVVGAAALATPLGPWPLVAVAGTYGAFLLAGALVLARETGIGLLGHLVAALALMHVAWGAGFLAAAVRAAARGAGRLVGLRRSSAPA